MNGGRQQQKPISARREKMSKFKEYDVEEIDALCSLGRALSSPIRIEIMQLLY